MAKEYIAELEIRLPDRNGVPVPDIEIKEWGLSLGCHSVELTGTSDDGFRIFTFKGINRESVSNIAARVSAVDGVTFDPDSIYEADTNFPDHFTSAQNAVIFPSRFTAADYIYSEEGDFIGVVLEDGRTLSPGDYLDRSGTIIPGGAKGVIKGNPHDYETSLVTDETHITDGENNPQIEDTPAEGMPGWELPDIEIPDDWFEDLTGYDEQIITKTQE